MNGSKTDYWTMAAALVCMVMLVLLSIPFCAHAGQVVRIPPGELVIEEQLGQLSGPQPQGALTLLARSQGLTHTSPGQLAWLPSVTGAPFARFGEAFEGQTLVLRKEDAHTPWGWNEPVVDDPKLTHGGQVWQHLAGRPEAPAHVVQLDDTCVIGPGRSPFLLYGTITSTGFGCSIGTARGFGWGPLAIEFARPINPGQAVLVPFANAGAQRGFFEYALASATHPHGKILYRDGGQSIFLDFHFLDGSWQRFVFSPALDGCKRRGLAPQTIFVALSKMRLAQTSPEWPRQCVEWEVLPTGNYNLRKDLAFAVTSGQVVGLAIHSPGGTSIYLDNGPVSLARGVRRGSTVIPEATAAQVAAANTSIVQIHTAHRSGAHLHCAADGGEPDGVPMLHCFGSNDCVGAFGCEALRRGCHLRDEPSVECGTLVAESSPGVPLPAPPPPMLECPPR